MGFYSNEEFRGSGEAPGHGTPIREHYSETAFPAMLYRSAVDVVPSDDDGKQIRARNLIQGHALDTLIVASAAAMDTALAEGWSRTVAAAVASSEVAEEVEAARRGPGRSKRVEA